MLWPYCGQEQVAEKFDPPHILTDAVCLMTKRPAEVTMSHPTTKLILGAAQGDRDAIDALLPLVYDELRAIAVRSMERERFDHTLQPTALVNEAFLRLADQKQVNWQSKAHFCAIAATMMRRVLVDHARRRAAEKREGKTRHVPVDEAMICVVSPDPVDIVALNDLMERLSQLNPRHARVFELRCFGGLDVRETAQVLDISEATVKNDWRFARAWLAAQLRSDSDN